MSKKENTYSSPNKTHFNQSKKPDLLKHQVRTKDKNVQLHQPPHPSNIRSTMLWTEPEIMEGYEINFQVSLL